MKEASWKTRSEEREKKSASERRILNKLIYNVLVLITEVQFQPPNRREVRPEEEALSLFHLWPSSLLRWDVFSTPEQGGCV